MSGISQKELLIEGFLDAMRAAGRAAGGGLVKGVGGAIGAGVGAVAGAAKQVARDVYNADTSASIFGVAGQGISGAKKGAEVGANIASKGATAITGKEEAALRKTLETEYRDIFQTTSLNIRRGQPDPSNMDIMIIPFTARKLGDPTILTPDTNIATGETLSVTGIQKPGNYQNRNTLIQYPFINNLVNRAFGLTAPSRAQKLGMEGSPQGDLGKGANSRFNSPLTKFFTNLKNSQQGLFFGYVQKTGNQESPYKITVRDTNGQPIMPTPQEKKIQPKLDALLQTIPQFKPNNSTAEQWSVALLRVFSKGDKTTYRKIIDTVIPAASGNDTYVLTAADVATLRKSLKDDHMLISEKNTQIDLVLQLKNISSFYNRRYE